MVDEGEENKGIGDGLQERRRGRVAKNPLNSLRHNMIKWPPYTIHHKKNYFIVMFLLGLYFVFFSLFSLLN